MPHLLGRSGCCLLPKATLLHAARWASAKHGAARLPAGDCPKPTGAQPRRYAGGQAVLYVGGFLALTTGTTYKRYGC